MITKEYRVKRDHSIHDMVGKFDGVPIYQVGARLYYGDDLVSSEFASFIHIPFSHVSHIRLRLQGYLNPNAAGLRSSMVSGLLELLNGQIRKAHPKIISGNRSVRCVLKTEYGAFDDENEAHLHILWLVDERVRDLVEETVSKFFYILGIKHPSSIHSIVTHRIKDIGRQISYVCKVKGTRDPEYQYINGMKKVMLRKYLNKPEGLIAERTINRKKYDSVPSKDINMNTRMVLKYPNACHSFPSRQETSLSQEITSASPKHKTLPSLDFFFQKLQEVSFTSHSIHLDTTPTTSRNQTME